MKHNFSFILLVTLFSCGEEEPVARQAATVCRLVKMEQVREKEVSLRDEITYSSGKMMLGYYYTRQVGSSKWDYVERRDYAYTSTGINITITRPLFTIHGSFVLDEKGNLLSYSDDFFYYSYIYAYDGPNLYSDQKTRYVVRNGNIVERIDIKTGAILDRFTYDDHPNPLKGLFYEPIGNDIKEYFRFYNANNVLTHTLVSQGGTVRRYSYQYGEQGYPTKQTWVGQDRTVNYTYKCE